MLKRTLSEKLTNNLDKTPKSIMLLGPRQTGKSTLLRTFTPILDINLADEGTYRKHLKDPDLLRSMCEPLPAKSLVLIDEIQRLPSLLNTVQSLVDKPSGPRFLLTGSSARKLRRGQANLIPGRLFWHYLYPLTYWELGDHFNLEKVLTLGSLPEIYLTSYGPELLKDYINTYLREEIQAEALTRNMSAFAHFLDLAAENSGLITNYSSLSSDSEIPKETLRRFYDILDDTLIVHRLQSFTAIDSKRKAVQKEMFIFFDMGVRNAVLNLQNNSFTPTELGKLFEQWFICQVIAFNEYHSKEWNISYYRDDQKNEVDLIIDLGKTCVAIEIKYGQSFKNSYIDGLIAFSQITKKSAKLFLVYRGHEVQRRENVDVMNYEKFLKEVLFTI